MAAKKKAAKKTSKRSSGSSGHVTLQVDHDTLSKLQDAVASLHEVASALIMTTDSAPKSGQAKKKSARKSR